MKPSRRLVVLFLVFGLSGFSGLIYESIWTHYLKLFLGHAAYAQTLVLAIFMGGMAIGSWICGRYSRGWRNLLVGYAVTEALIGLMALGFHGVFTSAIAVSYERVIPALGSSGLVTAYKWTLSTLLILPESLLLGMTFPLMTAGILRLFPERPGRSIAMLYFTNSIGAAIGVLVSGFALIKLLGLPGTIRTAGLINLFLAAIVWALMRNREGEGAGIEASARVEDVPRGWPAMMLGISLVTGASSFVYEIGWIRMLSLVLGSSTHAFELMLSAFIFGLAFGGLWIQRRIDRVASPVRYLAIVQLAMGLLALSTLVVYGRTFEVMKWLVLNLPKTEQGYALFNLSSNGIALAIMLPTTFCAGMTLPLITFVLLKRGYGERSIGAVYAANTVGAIVGVFLAVHLGLPMLGLKGLLVLGGGLDMALAVVLFARHLSDGGSRRALTVATATSVGAMAAVLLLVQLDDYKMASGVFRRGDLLTADTYKLLSHQDGKTATVSLLDDANGVVSIRTNGKSDAALAMRPGSAPTSDEYTMVLAAAIPMMLRPELRTAATIGFGSGLTTHSLLCNERLERVDTVEIEAEMVRGAQQFRPLVERAFADPRGRVFIDDAKTFFSTHDRAYDLIVSEPSNPWVSGVAGLFSEEFYHLVRRHLNERGLFAQWVQLYEMDTSLVASILKALSAAFPDYAVFASNNGDMIVIASREGEVPAKIDGGLLATAGFSPLAERLGLLGEQDIVVRRVGTKKVLQGWLDSLSAPANSDYVPYLDQNAAKARFLGGFPLAILDFGHVPLPALEMLVGHERDWTETHVTYSSYSNAASRTFTAMGLRDYFRTGRFGSEYAPLSREIGGMAVRLDQLFRECTPDSSVERLNLSFSMAAAMTPFLSRAEMEDYWRARERQRCWSSLSAAEQRWYALFQAVARRDGAAMLRSSVEVMNGTEGVSGPAAKYVVAAGMLGAIVEGDTAVAQRLWQASNGGRFGDAEPELLFQILAAESARGVSRAQVQSAHR